MTARRTGASRSRGAQPNNTNALKHGFYSRQFRSIDIQDLDALNLTLLDEIAAMRVAGRRMMELTEQITDPVAAIHCYAAFGANCQRVARLLHVHKTLAGGDSELYTVISQALDEAWLELKKKK